MPMEMLSELYGYGVAPNDRLLDANGNAQRALSMVTEWLPMTGSLMPMGILSEFLVTEWLQMIGSLMPMEWLGNEHFGRSTHR